jgi:hypothetical protein
MYADIYVVNVDEKLLTADTACIKEKSDSFERRSSRLYRHKWHAELDVFNNENDSHDIKSVAQVILTDHSVLSTITHFFEYLT